MDGIWYTAVFSVRYEGERCFMEPLPVVMGCGRPGWPRQAFSESIIKAQQKQFLTGNSENRSFDQELHKKFQIEVLK